ncbi:MAG: PKD domain-containing protein [Bacteroidetes bacterium]|nr:PKD domain-containing protein [Bacteroidota bacterium]
MSRSCLKSAPFLICSTNSILLLVLLLFSDSSFATHIVGGEMNYRNLGGNLYEIKLTVYRDCYNGIAPFDNPASVGIFDANNNLVSVVSPSINDRQQVPNAINTPCLIPPSDVCYEVAHYIFTTSLPPIAGGYQIVYQRCCRNSTIVNLANVNSTGATYLATIPDPSVATVNSNPIFNSWPPTFICLGAPFTNDHSASDPDGDSLVYELCTPYNGADPNTPMPQPPNPPPYDTVVFIPPYSLSDVMGGTPMTIDSRTGQLKATPSSIGQYVYGVRVLEFRNGVKIGVTQRDFQVNVVPCPQITVASIFSPTIVCGSLVAAFTNNSFNAGTYSWNFGDTSTTADTSSVQNPNWLYPDTGNYLATLIAYSPINPDCNDTAEGIVRVYPVFNAAFNTINERCKSVFEFKDQSWGIGGTASFWAWSFGDGQTSTVRNPSHDYTEPGLYDVQLITSTDSACLDTMTQTISVLQVPVASFIPSLDTCKRTLSIVNTSEYASEFHWNFGDSFYSDDESPEHAYGASGTYLIQATVVTDSGCVDTSGVYPLTIPPLPKARFLDSVASCDSVVTFTNTSSDASFYSWDFGDGDTSDLETPQHTYEMSGHIPVTLIATSDYGCKDTVSRDLFFVSFKKAEFNSFLDSCSGLVSFRDVTKNAVYYHWDFGDGDTSTVAEPVHKYKADGEYRVVLKVNNETSCIDTVFNFTHYESPLGESVYIPNSFTPNGDNLNDIFKAEVFRPCDIYSLSIFDRWGQMVYETDDVANTSWDGTLDGRRIESGVYVYILKGTDLEKRGIINIVR